MAKSTAFQKTWRLRELLFFLCDRALGEAGAPDEPEIAQAVFGRGPDFDPTGDSLVRVQVAQLRKRLRQYFGAEGVGEPMVIDMPRGSYTVVFRERDPEQAVPAEDDAEGEDAGRTPEAGRRLGFALGAGALALFAVAVGLSIPNGRGARPEGPGAPPRPSVERLWRQLFANGRPVRVVLADSSLTVFLDVTRRELSPSAYQRGDFAPRYGAPPQAASQPEPPPVELARQLLKQPSTSLVDADLAHRAGVLLAAVGVAGEIRHARDATPDSFRSANAILSGPRRSNPWVDLFEGQLNFHAEHDRRASIASFTNRAPQPGESARYTAVPDQDGYCRVAHVPNLDRTGSVLLLTGTDFASTQAGIEFVTREAEVAGLRQRLGLPPEAPFPPFEVLLRVRLAAGTFEAVAQRSAPPSQ